MYSSAFKPQYILFKLGYVMTTVLPCILLERLHRRMWGKRHEQ